MSGRGCVYLLDANVFIQAYLRYYSFDLVPRFWPELVKYVQNGRIKSIDRVLNEIYKKDDDLKKWVNEKIEQCFEDTDHKDVLDEYASLINWAQNQDYTTGAKNNFVKADNADAWVVAYAKARDFTVVTQEYFNEDARKKVQVPNVCQHFNVRWLNTFDMMRELGIVIK